MEEREIDKQPHRVTVFWRVDVEGLNVAVFTEKPEAMHYAADLSSRRRDIIVDLTGLGPDRRQCDPVIQYGNGEIVNLTPLPPRLIHVGERIESVPSSQLLFAWITCINTRHRSGLVRGQIKAGSRKAMKIIRAEAERRGITSGRQDWFVEDGALPLYEEALALDAIAPPDHNPLFD